MPETPQIICHRAADRPRSVPVAVPAPGHEVGQVKWVVANRIGNLVPNGVQRHPQENRRIKARTDRNYVWSKMGSPSGKHRLFLSSNGGEPHSTDRMISGRTSRPKPSGVFVTLNHELATCFPGKRRSLWISNPIIITLSNFVRDLVTRDQDLEFISEQERVLRGFFSQNPRFPRDSQNYNDPLVRQSHDIFREIAKRLNIDKSVLEAIDEIAPESPEFSLSPTGYYARCRVLAVLFEKIHFSSWRRELESRSKPEESSGGEESQASSIEGGRSNSPLKIPRRNIEVREHKPRGNRGGQGTIWKVSTPLKSGKPYTLSFISRRSRPENRNTLRREIAFRFPSSAKTRHPARSDDDHVELLAQITEEIARDDRLRQIARDLVASFRSLMDDMQDPRNATTPEGYCSLFNTRFCAQFGITEGDLRNVNMYEIIEGTREPERVEFHLTCIFVKCILDLVNFEYKKV